MEKRVGTFFFKLLSRALPIAAGLFCAGCRVLTAIQSTPLPLVTTTPEISLEQITEIPTLPPMTPTPTSPPSAHIHYEAPGSIFQEAIEEKLPESFYQSVVLRATYGGAITETDDWGNTVDTGNIKALHWSGTDYTISCDEYCFYVDAEKSPISPDVLTEGLGLLIFGTSGEDITQINADMIAIDFIPENLTAGIVPDLSELSQMQLEYTEYELEEAPELNPIRLTQAPFTATPTPTATEENAAEYDPYSAYYGYGYSGYDALPTSTPNRPSEKTPRPTPEGGIVPTPTEDVSKTLNDRLQDRLSHSLENRSQYNYGAYGEKYTTILNYSSDDNRDPEHPSRTLMTVQSNGYDFYELWFPYTENPMFMEWGVVCYQGDWYMPLRLSIDIDPDPQRCELVYSDRVIRNQKNYDEEKGYYRSFGHSIINDRLFYFYQNANGYGISIGLTDYDLGFDEIPFGYVGSYTELNPFYADDLITFFGHRGDKWYYVEINQVETPYNSYYGWY